MVGENKVGFVDTIITMSLACTFLLTYTLLSENKSEQIPPSDIISQRDPITTNRS